MMKLYNTLTRQKEEFVPLEEGKVKMYACGPTVYNFIHIGNARSLVVFDMFRRILEYRGYEVKFVQNFTDIDDKMIKRANEEGTTVPAIAEKYIGEYMTDAGGLGITPATIHPKATENIPEIIALIEKLIENGHAYLASNGDVYYSTKSFKGYGKLSHMNIDDLESGARIDITEEKRDPLDFALWKASKPGEPYWESPFGEGRPGWHIECSAMVCKYLGESIDIHCGGQDLTFPHHENEIAQSEGATGKNFSKYWLHIGYINVDNKKMSKSAGNFFTVRDVSGKYGYQPIRFFILSSHYRSPINYSTDIIEQAENALERIHNCCDSLKFYISAADKAEKDTDAAFIEAADARRRAFIEFVEDDFNTADAISAVFDLVRDINTAVNGEVKPSEAAAQYMYDVLLELLHVLGFEPEEADSSNEAEILDAIAKRAEAKKAKNYAEADRIRAELLERGIVLEDTPQGTKYKIVK